MTKYVLIGGGDIRHNETEKIDKYIVELSNKETPVVLFIGLASSYADSYYDAVKRQYSKLGCLCSYLKKSNLINNHELALNKFKSADIIYIGGGDSLKLMDKIREYDLIDALSKLDDKVVVGMSAGAIMLARMGLSDSNILRGTSDKMDFVEGLGLVNINICPHYNRDVRKEELKSNLGNTLEAVYGIEDNCALVINSSNNNIIKYGDNKVYLCYYKEKEYIEEVFYGMDKM